MLFSLSHAKILFKGSEDMKHFPWHFAFFINYSDDLFCYPELLFTLPRKVEPIGSHYIDIIVDGKHFYSSH